MKANENMQVIQVPMGLFGNVTSEEFNTADEVLQCCEQILDEMEFIVRFIGEGNIRMNFASDAVGTLGSFFCFFLRGREKKALKNF